MAFGNEFLQAVFFLAEKEYSEIPEEEVVRKIDIIVDEIYKFYGNSEEKDDEFYGAIDLLCESIGGFTKNQILNRIRQRSDLCSLAREKIENEIFCAM